MTRSREIASVYALSEEDIFILEAAAWFHDTGYLFVKGIGHETMSIDILKDSLMQLDISSFLYQRICNVILSTSLSIEPISLLDQIICDADTYHFGTSKFKITNDLVRQEMELLTGNVIANWITNATNLLL